MNEGLLRRLAKLAQLAKKLSRSVHFEVHAWWRHRPIRPGTVLYESFAGNGMLCNPLAIFEALSADARYSHLRHIWVVSRDASGGVHPRVARVVTRGSFAYYRALATSQYLVNNATFPPQFSKRPGQIYLNTWHGTPLKKMGFDMPDGGLESANTLRNFLAADYLLSANPHMTTTMYLDGYKLRGIFRGRILELGYPRTDVQFAGGDANSRTRRRIEDAGVPLGDRRLVLFAPTWKGSTFRRPVDDVDELRDKVAKLQHALDPDRFVVALKTHQAIYGIASRDPQLRTMLIPNEIPTNAILAVTDALVTDYSSLYFDYLSTERPIVFYTPDLDQYASGRGLYRRPEDLPGPVVRTIDDAAAKLLALTSDTPESGTWADRRRDARAEFCPRDDGGVSSRVIDVVFGGADAGNIRTSDDRTSLLMYAGGMRRNGISSAALNLLDSIDHSRFDVTMIYPHTNDPIDRGNYDAVNPAVRQIPRVGGMNGSKFTHLRRHLAVGDGTSVHRRNPRQRAMWDEEWTRCFGDSEFDFVVDFSGYSPFWATLLLHSPGGIRSIWLHNEMVRDANRTVGNRRTLRRNLHAVFRLYPEFDRLVSVSGALSAINATELADYASSEHFVSARNSAGAARIHAPIDTAQPRIAEFITVSRLSPEKNHARLLRAFAIVRRSQPSARLMIVGDGPLFTDLTALSESLGLADAVTFTGMHSDPIELVQQAGCFLMSSDYEGQPMVFLEALEAGVPIVTVAFGSVRDALPPGSGLIVDQTDDALAEGMLSYLRGEVEAGSFDRHAYNQSVVDEFYAAIGAPA